MNGIIELVFGGFPNGYCPQDWDTLIEDAYSYTSVNFTTTGNVYYNIGSSIPSVDNRIYPWFRTGATLPFENGWYYWDSSYWVMAHTCPASGDERRLFVGTLAGLKTYDGGADVAVTDYTGPFWEVDTNFDGRIPMGPGTVGAYTLAVAANLGAATSTLSNDNLKHTHPFGNYAGGNDDGRFLIGTSQTFAPLNSMEIHGDTGDPQEANITAGNLITGPATVDATATAVEIVPPVRGAYIIKRTARIWRAVI